MRNKNSFSMIWIMSGVVFVVATLLMSLGFLKTIFIIIATLAAAWGGYLLDKNNIDVQFIMKKLLDKD